jgi:hypothetical protein
MAQGSHACSHDAPIECFVLVIVSLPKDGSTNQNSNTPILRLLYVLGRSARTFKWRCACGPVAAGCAGHPCCRAHTDPALALESSNTSQGIIECDLTLWFGESTAGFKAWSISRRKTQLRCRTNTLTLPNSFNCCCCGRLAWFRGAARTPSGVPVAALCS